MKAPAFQFYPQDFISSLDVQLMSAAEVGAYCLLLFNSWTQPQQGYLPNDEAQLRHLSRLSPDEWKASKKKLLAKFPLSEDKKLRYNPRLVAEAQKHAAFREKQAAHGKKGGRPRREEKPAEAEGDSDESQKNPTLSQPLGQPKANESSLSSTSSSMPTNVGKEADPPADEPTPLKAQKGGYPLRDHGDTPLFDASTWPSLNDPARFADLCAKLGYPQVDFERYRHQIGMSLDGKQLPASSLRKWVESYLNNDFDEGNLLLPIVQVPNERPSNYHGTAPYVAPPGGRIPDMSSILNPNWKPPTA